MLWIWLWRRRHNKGARVRWWAMLAIAIFFFAMMAVGISMTTGEPDCDGQVQRTDQVCRYSDGTVKDYAKEKASDQRDGVALAIVTGLIGVFCLGVAINRFGKSSAQLRAETTRPARTRPAAPIPNAYADQVANYAAAASYQAAPPPPPPPPGFGSPDQGTGPTHHEL